MSSTAAQGISNLLTDTGEYAAPRVVADTAILKDFKRECERSIADNDAFPAGMRFHERPACRHSCRAPRISGGDAGDPPSPPCFTASYPHPRSAPRASTHCSTRVFKCPSLPDSWCQAGMPGDNAIYIKLGPSCQPSLFAAYFAGRLVMTNSVNTCTRSA